MPVSDLFLFVGLMVLWLGIAWYIFCRFGFFGAQKPPRFSITRDGGTFASDSSTYLVNGIANGRHLVFVYQAPDGTPFVYHSRDKDIQTLEGADGLDAYVREHCGGDKGMKVLRDAQAKGAAS
jgi:hypothetical protein